MENKVENKKRNVALRTILVIAFLLLFSLITIISLRSKYLNVKQIGDLYTKVLEQDLKNSFLLKGIKLDIVYFAM